MFPHKRHQKNKLVKIHIINYVWRTVWGIHILFTTANSGSSDFSECVFLCLWRSSEVKTAYTIKRAQDNQFFLLLQSKLVLTVAYDHLSPVAEKQSRTLDSLVYLRLCSLAVRQHNRLLMTEFKATYVIHTAFCSETIYVKIFQYCLKQTMLCLYESDTLWKCFIFSRKSI